MASNSKFHITRIVKTFAIKIEKKIKKKVQSIGKRTARFWI
jgi:hypothetical protein